VVAIASVSRCQGELKSGLAHLCTREVRGLPHIAPVWLGGESKL